LTGHAPPSPSPPGARTVAAAVIPQPPAAPRPSWPAALALDAGRLTYLQLQGADRGGDCGIANPCRVVRASDDPFGPEARPLAPKLALEEPYDTQDPAAQPRATQPLTLSGALTRSIMERGKVVRAEPVAGVPIALRRAGLATTPDEKSFEKSYRDTGLTATTAADGAFALPVPAPLATILVLPGPDGRARGRGRPPRRWASTRRPTSR